MNVWGGSRLFRPVWDGCIKDGEIQCGGVTVVIQANYKPQTVPGAGEMGEVWRNILRGSMNKIRDEQGEGCNGVMGVMHEGEGK